MRLALLLLPILILLSGCGRDDGQPENVASSANHADVEVTEETETPGDEPNDDSSGPPPSTVVNDATRVPAAFLGEWTTADQSCADRSAVTRLLVQPRALQFYESQGTIVSASQAGPRAIRVAVSYEGEGQSWSRDQTLTLSADGSRMTITDADGSIVRKRCPA